MAGVVARPPARRIKIINRRRAAAPTREIELFEPPKFTASAPRKGRFQNPTRGAAFERIRSRISRRADLSARSTLLFDGGRARRAGRVTTEREASATRAPRPSPRTSRTRRGTADGRTRAKRRDALADTPRRGRDPSPGRVGAQGGEDGVRPARARARGGRGPRARERHGVGGERAEVQGEDRTARGDQPRARAGAQRREGRRRVDDDGRRVDGRVIDGDRRGVAASDSPTATTRDGVVAVQGAPVGLVQSASMLADAQAHGRAAGRRQHERRRERSQHARADGGSRGRGRRRRRRRVRRAESSSRLRRVDRELELEPRPRARRRDRAARGGGVREARDKRPAREPGGHERRPRRDPGQGRVRRASSSFALDGEPRLERRRAKSEERVRARRRPGRHPGRERGGRPRIYGHESDAAVIPARPEREGAVQTADVQRRRLRTPRTRRPRDPIASDGNAALAVLLDLPAEERARREETERRADDGDDAARGGHAREERRGGVGGARGALGDGAREDVGAGRRPATGRRHRLYRLPRRRRHDPVGLELVSQERPARGVVRDGFAGVSDVVFARVHPARRRRRRQGRLRLHAPLAARRARRQGGRLGGTPTAHRPERGRHRPRREQHADRPGRQHRREPDDEGARGRSHDLHADGVNRVFARRGREHGAPGRQRRAVRAHLPAHAVVSAAGAAGLGRADDPGAGERARGAVRELRREGAAVSETRGEPRRSRVAVSGAVDL
eukprot:31346-Pelagococcus_subviridis.AAC.28